MGYLSLFFFSRNHLQEAIICYQCQRFPTGPIGKEHTTLDWHGVELETPMSII